ncbi:hypothetical protein HN51_019202 [Arachis hypogaea]
MDLPLGRMHALELDSKIHLVGFKYLSVLDYYCDGPCYPSKRVYELDLDKEVEESNPIDDFPKLLIPGLCSSQNLKCLLFYKDVWSRPSRT